jgi:chitinase
MNADPWQFGVDQIDTKLCTHLVYAFAELDENTFEIRPSLPAIDIDQNFYRKFTALKSQNPLLKTMLAFGGWVDSNINDKYSQLVSNSQNIDTFVRSAVRLLTDFGFDGLDVDWEYPKSDADKIGFTSLLVALKRAFAQRGFLLSAAVPGAETNLGRLISGYLGTCAACTSSI